PERPLLTTRATVENGTNDGIANRKRTPPVNVRRHNLYEDYGLHRNSDLPELRNIMHRKSGKLDLRCQRPAMTAEEEMLLYSRALTRRQVLKASAGAPPPLLPPGAASARAAPPAP